MPIPLIIWGIGLGGSALIGLVKVRSAVSCIKKAKERYAYRRSAYESFIAEYEKRHKFTSEQFDDLMKVRLQAMVTMGEAVRFLEKAKLKERELIEKFQITPQRMVEWKKASANAVEVLGGLVSSATSGAITAASAYGLVSVLASASTGTAISALSGAAATNATLAWLGGGTLAAGGGGVAAGTVVLGGLVAAPAILGVGFVASWQAAKVEAEVEKYVSDMDIDQANKEKIMSVLNVVVKRVHELQGSTVRTEGELKRLIESGDPSDDRDAYMVARTAKTLGDLLEVAIIDTDGNLVENSEP